MLQLTLIFCILCLYSVAAQTAAVGQGPTTPEPAEFRTWQTYGGDPGSTQYSALSQINTTNVADLRLAWSYETGDAEEQGSQIQCNPIIVENRLFGTTAKLKVFALDAATGQEIWRFDPYGGSSSGQGINRGVSYWRSAEDERILFTAGTYLYALNASDGTPVVSFGEEGRVDLRTGLGRDPRTLQVDVTTPGAVFRDLIILGSRVGETPGAAPGHIRAYDIRTGRLVWVFHTIPQPGEFGYATWPPQAWQQVGGANAWAGLSVDLERALVFAPTGSASYDFYGGNRHGDNLFANTLLALDAATGKRRWHFQIVHHDLWDRDLPAPPNLVTLTRGAQQIAAVAQITKTGHVFVFDRDTGKPLYPVEERQVAASDVAGERASPTQPVPLKPPPFTRQRFSAANVTNISASARTQVLARLPELRTGEPFLPPTVDRHTVVFPGFDGGAEWGGAAYDPVSGYLYVNATELPWSYALVKLPREGVPGQRAYAQYCASCHGLDRRGNGRDSPSLIGVGERLSYPAIAGLIRQGKGQMPGFPQLGFENIMLLLDYLNRAETTAAGAELAGDVDAPDASEIPFMHTGYFRVVDAEGFPAIEPPWGTLTAIDLNAGTIAWQVPLGSYPQLVAKGMRNTGTENYGGPVVTAGGLVFIAATMDEQMRAFDKATGEVLWSTSLPAAGFATPSTYEIAGKQYLVIAAGGGKSGLRSGGLYVAFSLPD
jgi:quinoprotein glucose dehydrogenase